MATELLIAVIAGIGGMLGWGLADFFAKKTIDQIGDVASLAWGHVFGSIFFIGFLIWQYSILGTTFHLPSQLSTWLMLIFFGVMQAAVYLLVYKGFSKGFVGLLSPVFASFSGLVALLSIAFLGEVVSRYIVIGLLVLFAGILLVNIDLQSLKSKKIAFSKIAGFKEVGLAAILAAFWTLSWDKFVGGNDWVSYVALMYMIMTIVIFIFAWINNIKLRVKKSSIWKFLLFIGVTEAFAYAAISLGYSTTTFTSVIAVLSGAFSIPTIILAHIFLREKISFIQTVGSIVTIAGIMMLAAA